MQEEREHDEALERVAGARPHEAARERTGDGREEAAPPGGEADAPQPPEDPDPG